MARQIVVDIIGNANSFTRATSQASAAGEGMSLGMGKASGAAKNLEKDLTSVGKSAAGNIPIFGGLGSSIGGLPLPALAAAAALAGLYVAGKSVIDISDRWTASQRGLKQATDATGASYSDAQDEVNAFIASNKRFIPSQAEVADSFAALTRELGPTGRVTEDLNLALDLSAIKHISLTEATNLLAMAEMGRGRALLPLGIQMKEFPVLTESQHQADVKLAAAEAAVGKATIAHTAAVKAHGPASAQAKAAADALAVANAKLAEAHNYAAERAAASAAVHDLLHKKLDGGRQATADLTQSANRLSNSWQSFSERTGPVLVNVLSAIANSFLGLLNSILDTIAAIGDLVGWIARIDVSKIPVLGGLVSAIANTSHASTPRLIMRASGGDVVPGQLYSVGEQGPELFSPGTAGTIIPAGGSGGGMVVHNHFEGAFILDGPTLDRLANMLAQRLTYATGR